MEIPGHTNENSQSDSVLTMKAPLPAFLWPSVHIVPLPRDFESTFKYLLSVYYVSDTVRGTSNTATMKTDEIQVFMEYKRKVNLQI